MELNIWQEWSRLMVVFFLVVDMHKQTHGQRNIQEGTCSFYFFFFLFVNAICTLWQNLNGGRRKKQEKSFCENLSKVFSCHQFCPSLNGPPVNGPYTVRFPLNPAPWPTHPHDTHLPSKLSFTENKIKDRKKKMTRGQTASHYHNSGNHITVPLRLIQRSSRRTSYNLQWSNRNITLINPPTLNMETDRNKKLIEEHPAPPTHEPHPIKPHTPPVRLKYVWGWPLATRAHKVFIKEPLTGGSLVFHSWNKLLGLWVQAALALLKNK